jgi:hypothetical protein
MRSGFLAITSACALACALLLEAPRAQYVDIDATGLVPLNDLVHDAYAGHAGGLYPMGVNMRPPAHDQAGLDAGATIVPLDAQGQPDPVNGRIVMVTSGMSNTGIITYYFKKLVAKDPARSGYVKVVNGAHSGKTADAVADPSNPYWDFLRKDIVQAGVAPAQVQVVWMLQVEKATGLPFPEHAELLADRLEQITQLMKAFFPNLRIMYISSRIYGGHDGSGKSPEPHAFESGFGVKWVIERQIQGDPALNHDPAKGPVLAPWLAWGPYLWADGTIERGDGMTWQPEDFLHDGLHPSRGGGYKAAGMLLDFLHTDATARPWYLRDEPAFCPMQASVSLYGGDSPGARGAPRLGTNILPTAGAATPLSLYVRGAPSGAQGWFVVGEPLPAGAGVPVAGGGKFFMDLSTALVMPVTTNPVGQAWMQLGKLPRADAVICDALMHAQFVVWTGQGYSFSRPVAMRVGH